MLDYIARKKKCLKKLEKSINYQVIFHEVKLTKLAFCGKQSVKNKLDKK